MRVNEGWTVKRLFKRMVSKRWHKLHQIIGMSTFSVDLVSKVLSLLPMIDQVNHRSGVRSQFSRVVWNLWFPWNRSMKKYKKNQKIHTELSFAVRLGDVSYWYPPIIFHLTLPMENPWCIWGPSRFAIRSYWSCMGAASHQTVRTPSGLGTVGSWTAVKLREFGTV